MYTINMVVCMCVHLYCLFTGIVVPVGPDKTLHTCKAVLLCSTLDLPAKAKVLGFHQFNGEYGCASCEQEGRVVAVGKGRARVYEYLNPPAHMRSHKESYTLGLRALRTQEV